MKLIKKLTYFGILLLLMQSCSFYSTKGTIPIHIKDVYIKPIQNNSIDQEVVNLLDIQLNQLLLNQNILKIVEYDEADSKVYYSPMRINCLIQKDEKSYIGDDAGYDSTRTGEFNFLTNSTLPFENGKYISGNDWLLLLLGTLLLLLHL